jgi:hypothetical protein
MAVPTGVVAPCLVMCASFRGRAGPR